MQRFTGARSSAVPEHPATPHCVAVTRRRYRERVTRLGCLGGGRASGAQSEDVDDVLGLREAVLRGDRARPLLDVVRFDLDRQAAGAADQVMVVAAGRARAVEALALVLQRVGFAFDREVGERAVDGGEPDDARRLAARRAATARSRTPRRYRAPRAPLRAATCCASCSHALTLRVRRAWTGDVDHERDRRDVRADRQRTAEGEQDAAHGRHEPEGQLSSGTTIGDELNRIAAAAA